jgi:very-short-patch-repair endonuclease
MFARDGDAAGAVRRAKGLRERMNYPEQRHWRELRKLDAHIRRQAPIGRCVADFACHSKRVVVEVEGRVHEVFADVALRDIERTAWLQAQGDTVLRFSDRQVLDDFYGVVDAVKQALALPLDGGRLGGGEVGALAGEVALGSEPSGAWPKSALPTPPSPTLPPSRGKGEDSSDIKAF